jgi:eukaryotic-like serine/threonine-protein kinase
MDPTRIGRYRIDGVLGSGAMGIVYRGFDPGVGRVVAIKTVRKELLDGQQPGNVIERFRREARAAGRLSHPNIVTVHDFGEDAHSAYLVCEYVAGVALDRWLAEHGRADLATVLAWMGQLLNALEFAHAHGVVHRDVKAANLLVEKGRQLKLADFGIAQLDASDLTQAGLVLGTPSCMAPEQILQQTVDGRADVFAAGVLLYVLLTGTRPFPGPAERAMQQILDDTPAPPSQVDASVPAAFDAVVARALAKRPDERYRSASAFLAALRAAAGAMVPSTGEVGPDAISLVVGDEATLVLPRRGGAQDPRTPNVTASGWTTAALDRIEAKLRMHVGPIAPLLVRKAAKRSTTIDELMAQLALDVADPSARAGFLAAGDLRTSGGEVLTRGAPTQSASGAPSAALDDASIARVQDRLAAMIGPMASIAMRRALPEATTLSGLVQCAARFVPDARDRHRFLGEFGLPSTAVAG